MSDDSIDLYFSRIAVAAGIVALGNQVIPRAGVVHLIAFFHLLHAPAVRVVEFACVCVDYIFGASGRNIVLCSGWGSDHNTARGQYIFFAG